MTRCAIFLLAATLCQAQDAPHLANIDPPAAKVSLDEAIKTGVEFLVKNQNKSGSFGKRTTGRTYEIMAGVPGGHYAFEAASTSLCWMGLHGAPYQTDASKKAAQRALAWLVKNATVKRARAIELYNTWAFAYGLRAISVALQSKDVGVPEADLRKTANELVAAMKRYQTPDGGWGYYEFRYKTNRPTWSTSFSTASSLIALRAAEQAGVPVPPKMLDKAMGNLRLCRKPDGTFLYGSYMKYAPNHGVNKPQGASMRVQSCNLAMFLQKKEVGVKDLRDGVEMLMKHYRFAIAGVRRPRPHESHYAVSGYFYLYGYSYAGDTLGHLPKLDQKRFAPQIAKAVLKTRQPDGSYWDYPLYGYHKFYGTGYALMTLARCKACSAKD